MACGGALLPDAAGPDVSARHGRQPRPRSLAVRLTRRNTLLMLCAYGVAPKRENEDWPVFGRYCS